MAKAVDIRRVVEGVRARDYTVQLVARTLGGAANTELAELLQDPDAEVRELAVHCLDESGGPGAAEALVPALLDEDLQVSMAAAKALHTHGAPHLVRPLLSTYDLRPEPPVLRELALVLGRLEGWVPVEELLRKLVPVVGGLVGPPPVELKRRYFVSELKQRYLAESDAQAKEGLLWALARLGDEEARREFAARLEGSAGTERKRYLDGVAYLGQPWVLKALLPVLDDRTPLVRVGVDARPDLIDTLRACDIALELIAKIGKARFSFPVPRPENYSDAELAEAKAWVAGLP